MPSEESTKSKTTPTPLLDMDGNGTFTANTDGAIPYLHSGQGYDATALVPFTHNRPADHRHKRDNQSPRHRHPQLAVTIFFFHNHRKTDNPTTNPHHTRSHHNTPEQPPPPNSRRPQPPTDTQHHHPHLCHQPTPNTTTPTSATNPLRHNHPHPQTPTDHNTAAPSPPTDRKSPIIPVTPPTPIYG